MALTVPAGSAAPVVRTQLQQPVHAVGRPSIANGAARVASGAGSAIAITGAVLIPAALALRRARRKHRQPHAAVHAPAAWHPVCDRRSDQVNACLHALRWDVVESTKGSLEEAVGDLAAQAASSEPSFGLLVMPEKWSSDLKAAAQQFRAGSGLGKVPLIAVPSAGAENACLGMAVGGTVPSQLFFVNKEELSQAGPGLAKENPIPGVPDGKHGTILFFTDPKVPASLSMNLAQALDARYPEAVKAGMVVAAPKASEDEDDDEEDWEPPKDRRLRTRDRTDGHGWMRGDPLFDSTKAGAGSLTVEYKKRPCGMKRYAPGIGGKGAMVMDMFDKARYPGDALGQAATNGVTRGMVIASVNGTDVTGWDFEDLMDLVKDEGVVDPDSKSAATWGDAAKGRDREPVEMAPLPLTIAYADMADTSSGKASLILDGQSKRDGTCGIALPEKLGCFLELVGLKRAGPALQVAKAGLQDKSFAVNSVNVKGKEMPAAAALKGVAKAAGLASMKGIGVGIRRPAAAEGSDAGSWSVFPMAGVTKEGGLVLKCRGLSEEGLGPDDGLQEIQFFGPADAPADPSQGGLIFTTDATGAAAGSPSKLAIVGGAVLGAGGAETTPTSIHRQAQATIFFA